MKTFLRVAVRAGLPWLLLALAMASHAQAQRAAPATYASDFRTVQALLKQPESQMDRVPSS
ncbi:hypothetical protein [Variovorax sp. KK3]|uniref:hypothetical protein n=1 Tax=Variovorax sp. KK3 TaxID=1855728 RepID=UPI0015C3EFBF|nr:hypothetical protein [Variovorax sp. KK3]